MGILEKSPKHLFFPKKTPLTNKMDRLGDCISVTWPGNFQQEKFLFLLSSGQHNGFRQQHIYEADPYFAVNFSIEHVNRKYFNHTRCSRKNTSPLPNNSKPRVNSQVRKETRKKNLVEKNSYWFLKEALCFPVCLYK